MTTFLALLVAFSLLKTSLTQTPPYPLCAETCAANTYSVSGCLVTDIKCLCRSSAFYAAARACIESSCDATDQLLAHDYDVYICGQVGVTLPAISIATTAPATSALETVTGSSPVKTSSKAVSPTGTVGFVTTSIAASPAVTVVVGNQSKNIGPIVGGVVGGIVGLAAIIGGVFFVYKRGHDDGAQAAAVRQSIPPDDPLVRNQGSLVGLEKEALAPSAISERETGTAREQRGSVEPSQGFGDVEYGTVSSGYDQARHGRDIVETIPPVNVDLPSGRLRYPDGDDRQ